MEPRENKGKQKISLEEADLPKSFSKRYFPFFSFLSLSLSLLLFSFSSRRLNNFLQQRTQECYGQRSIG
jgi:hypothetical protein